MIGNASFFEYSRRTVTAGGGISPLLTDSKKTGGLKASRKDFRKKEKPEAAAVAQEAIGRNQSPIRRSGCE